MEEDLDEICCCKFFFELLVFKRYFKLVNGYFFWNLKYEGDVLNVFVGFLKLLSVELGDIYIWGLFKFVFDKVMFW